MAPALSSNERKSQERRRGDPGPNHEFVVPTNNQSPIPTLSSSGASDSSRFLDEIALLKRGKITRDTPKHTYRRGLSAEDANSVPVVRKPITVAELNTRGLRINQNHVIYNIPEELGQRTTPSNPATSNITTSSCGVSSTGTTLSSNCGVIKSPRNEKEYEVGNPGENAKLRISSIASKGRSYELSVDNDICILQQSSKNVVLITWKN
ncbi:hypothetical protein Y032_0088g2136 [Ancylostoma ceylanicum]|uniref:Uncharacterized protein n=1 Tax=Ancylostoma ceylanicum TaxID=53326 RepID=A0A016TNR8_9BILA|nr:hypothetical protein Y032_0088g2136 [Ancylostoma ceylanicum]